MVFGQAEAFFVAVTEGALGIGVAVFGGFTVEPAGLLNVFFAAESALVQPAEAVGCVGGVAAMLLKGACIPFAGAAVVGFFGKFV